MDKLPYMHFFALCIMHIIYYAHMHMPPRRENVRSRANLGTTEWDRKQIRNTTRTSSHALLE